MRLLLLSGPNLALLGERQPEIYGTATLDDHVAAARAVAERHGATLDHVQGEDEAALVRAVHDARGAVDGIVVNAAALTHYGWSLHDSLAAFEAPVVEVHLSNPYRREVWRNASVVTPVATGAIFGLGGDGYELAVEALVRLVRQRPR